MQKLGISPPLVMLVLTMGVARVEAEVPRLKIEHKSPILSVVWSPDGKWLATGTQDGTVRFLEPNSGKEIRRFSTGEAVPALVVAPDSRTLGIVSADQWNLGYQYFEGDEDIVKLVPPVNNTLFRFKSNQFFLLPHGNRAVGLQSGAYHMFILSPKGIQQGVSGPAAAGNIAAVACDGSVGGIHDGDGNIHVRISPTIGVPVLKVGNARCIAFVPGFRYVAVGSDDGNVHLWLWESNAKIKTLTGLYQPADSLMCSHDGNTLVALAADKRRIVSWDLAKMAKKGQVNHGLGKVHTFAVSPDGKLIATAAENGKTLFLWDASTIRMLVHQEQAPALSDQQAAAHWNDLANQDEKKADDAWQKLGAAGDSVIPFLRQNIRTHAVPAGDQKLIEKLVTDLGSEKFAMREAAVKELAALGEIAIMPLQRMLEKPLSLEAAARAKAVLQRIGEPELTPDRFRVLEAIELLEQLETAKAVELLQEIERDALIAQLHREASEALNRLGSIKKSK